MVFINSQKFACESCIKGHRSSSCTHTERPLYEVKKKGRPVSQCERCRQLRNTKRVHSKCTCSDGSIPRPREITEKVFGTKQKRYMPIAPALPNGLKDALTSSLPIAPAHPRQKVASLLNPCQCNEVSNCGCINSSASSEVQYPYGQFASDPQASSSGKFAAKSQTLASNGYGNNSAPVSGLETLARAAAAVLFSSPLTPQTPPSLAGPDDHACPFEIYETTTPPSPTLTPTPVLDLPPLLFPEVPGPSPVVPPFSTFTTLAGSGCTCGLTCQCPDCATHNPRPDVNSNKDLDCMNCVDPSLDVIDRSANGEFHVKSPVLEKFFADAKRVPPPPTVGGKPVELPKLCCGGSCSCGGACGCSGDCNGCCEDDESGTPMETRNDSVSVTITVDPPM